jgi:hypothetical protein
MATYLIFTPAGGPGKDHRDTRFVRDGFSLTAFFFPGFWLLWQQLWILGASALLVQALAVEMMRLPGLWPAGFATLLGVSVLAAVEGRNMLAKHLVSSGWKEVGLVSATRLADAEEIYFDDLPEESVPNSLVRWDIRSHGNADPGGAALGLIGYDGGR